MPDVGDKVQLEIEDVAYRGPGIARLDGLVVFVDRVAPGERVEAEIIRVRKNFAEASLLQILQPSPHRIPSCAAGADGVLQPGCAYDFLDYATEVEIKQKQMAGLLRHFPGIVDATLEPFASPRPLNYRKKIVLHAQRVGRDPATIGYYRPDNRTVVDLDRCALAHDAINFAWAAQRAEACRKLENGQSVTLRWTAADGVSSWVDQAPADAPLLTETSPGGPLKLHPDGFYQVNGEVGDALVLQVRDWAAQAAAEMGEHTLLDLYCGVGVFALNSAGPGATSVQGIESAQASVAAARLNAREWNRRATFRCAHVEDAARIGFGVEDLGRTLVISDPPRKGMEPGVLSALGNGRVPHLIIAACDPATLARDLKRLQPFGYRLRAARMLDMFPRTPHFETAVWLSL